MGNIFTRNVAWKITSIILAFFIWFAVIRIEDPTDDKPITHIPVQVLKGNVPIGDSNVISINNSNKKQYITIEKGEYVNVRVSAKKSVLEKLRAGDIKATANIEELSPFGAIAIHIDGEKNFDVINIEPTHMYIGLENSKKEIKSIEVNPIGKVRDSYRIIEEVRTPNTVEITGAESKVDLVVKALVDVQVEDAFEDVSTVAPIRLYDTNGKEIILDKSIDKVEVSVKVRKYKTVTLNVNPTGKVAAGYKLTGSTVVPKQVEIIGTEEAIDSINIITLPVDLTGLNEDTKVSKNINDYLKDVTVSDKSSAEATIELRIDKIIEKEVAIEPGDIIAKLPANGLKLSILNEENINLVFRGIEEDLNRVSSISLSPSVDLSNLTEGTHEVSLVLNYTDAVELVSPLPKINVEITKEVETTISDNVNEEPSTDSSDPVPDPDPNIPSEDNNNGEGI